MDENIINTINIMKLSDDAIIPTRGSNDAAGYDLYANNITTNDGIRYNGNEYTGCWIQPHHTVKIGTGIAIEIPNGYFGGIFARSGLSTKQFLRPANCVGCIDSDYRGEIIVALHNDSDKEQYIELNSRIAQLVIMPYLSFDINVVKQLHDTERGDGGFGSTGVN